ncbi:MAG: bifunctional diguanylate cyclase/phosphodiesterase [Lachnospiraceae bacterium]|nr:bifunctional diguanylate cyclase/phosphodiesterase [Lachnospiraceae bacterium]
MDYQDVIQNMSLEQIISVIEVLQKSSDSYLFIMDLNEDIYMISEKATKRFPFDTMVIENCTEMLKQVVYPSDYAMVEADIVKCASGDQDSHALEYRWFDRKGKVVWINCKGTVVVGPEGHRLLIGRVSELGKKAKADNVTGLRREVRFRLDAEAILRDRPQSVHYMMRIGIDNFKEINEKEGLEAGDEVLQELAECIVASVDESVDVYRLLADEFMIMDASTNDSVGAKTVYNRIKRKVTQTVRQKEYSRFYTISAGVMEEGFEDKTADEILRLTEFALNEAKRNGRNQMAVFDQENYNEYLRRLDIRKAMRRDVNNDFNGFQVFYQPIVKAPDFQVVGAEALLRWGNERYGNVSPAVFIPILEESGLIIPVGRYVLREAARTCKKWRESIGDFKIHVNLSYVQVHKSDLMKDVETCIEEVGLEPDSLVLELTESGYIETNDRIKEIFSELKDKNIDLALDDFGTGYSNMRYLKEIEAKTVKIDRSFVIQALQNEHDYNIINHIIDMVHSLGSSVCMEGIEQSDELDKMMKTHPDMIQGYYFGKPSPKEQFENQFLQTINSP